MEDLFQKFKKQFIQEIQDQLEQLEKDLLELEIDPGNREVIDSIFRAMHTIKGTSGMYGCMFMSDFTHHFENIYQNLRENNLEAEKEIIDLSLSSLDHLKALLYDEKLANPDNKKNHAELLSRIEGYLGKSKPSETATKQQTLVVAKKTARQNSWYILVRTDEQIFFRGISLTNLLKDLSNLGTYYIHRIPSLSNAETETWGIVLISEASINDIKEVFMFIEDNCSFTLIKEGDILKPGQNAEHIVFEPSLSEITTPAMEPVNEPVKLAEAVERQNKSGEQKKGVKTSLLINDTGKFNVKRINVESAKLDYLMYLVSELITLNSQLLQTTKDDYYEGIRPQIEQMESLVKLFRNNALEIRLVPLNELVVKFQRLVRDLSNQLGKKVEFATYGTDIELDKNTIDLIAEPIIHIIRNCIDHGIEYPAERVNKGKPETGIVKLSASHVGNYIHIRIEDDGKGIDLNRIRDKAIEKGIISANDKLSKKELTELIFSSGLSTAKDITSVSGRGVGMDVVKKTINELRGEILVDTEEEKGSSFTLKIQQSVAIIDTLLFRVEKTYFILPLTEIEICIQTEMADFIKNQNTKTIEYNKQMIPYVDLRTFFNLKGEYSDVVKTVIVKDNGQYVALLSDEILGEQQAVLKPLGQAFRNDTGILAVSQHGDGKWAYMLSASALHK
jgi:Chemotaxis protein histidine kinase and related kinases